MAWSDAARAAALEMRKHKAAGQPWRLRPKIGDRGSYADWKQAQEYEGRIFFGAYHWTRQLRAHRTSFIARALPLARERYNTLRLKFGLQKITDWKTTPPRAQLVQFVKSPRRK